MDSRKIYRSEIVPQDLNPTWKPLDIAVAEIGDIDRKLTLRVYDWDKNANRDCIFNTNYYIVLLLIFSIKILDFAQLT